MRSVLITKRVPIFPSFLNIFFCFHLHINGGGKREGNRQTNRVGGGVFYTKERDRRWREGKRGVKGEKETGNRRQRKRGRRREREGKEYIYIYREREREHIERENTKREST